MVRSEAIRLALVAGSALSVGFVLGGVIERRRMHKAYDEDIQREIKKTQEEIRAGHHRRLVEYVTQDVEATEQLLEDISEKVDRVEEAVGVEETVDEPSFDPVERVKAEVIAANNGYLPDRRWTHEHVWANGEPFPFEDEEDNRKSGRPYLITEHEYQNDCEEYDKATLTAYSCGTVADDKDQPVGDIETLLRKENLTRWGVGSSSSDVLYIRNDRSEIDFEICRDALPFNTAVYGE